MLILANIAGWFVANWRLLAVVGGVVGLLIVFGLVMKSCSKREAKIDLEQINKINKADEADRKKELQTIIEKNQDVVKTVDERNTIAETSEDEKQAHIYLKIKEADAKIAEAKANGKDVTQAELVCLLTGEGC